MGKVRVHTLAKELGVPSGELMEMMKADGFDVATASTSIEEDVAQRYRTRLGGTAAARPAPAPAKPAASAAAKSGGAKKSAPPPPPKKHDKSAVPALVLPPPAPIERRPKAVKPQRPKEVTPDLLASIEERRSRRIARLRGDGPREEVPVAVAEEPAEIPELPPEPVAPVAEMMAVASASEGESEGEFSTESLVAEHQEAPPIQLPHLVQAAPIAQLPHVVQSAPAAQLPHVVQSAPATQLPHVVHLPHVVEQAPAQPSASTSTSSAPTSRPTGPPLPQLVRPPQASQQQPPSLPMRGVREFRGPVRKIELPPQPSRPGFARQPGPPSPSQPPTGIGRTAQPSSSPTPGQGMTRSYPQKPGMGLGKSKAKRKGRDAAPAPVQPAAPIKKGDGALLRLTEGVTVKELADKMEVKAKDIIRILMMRGVMVTVTMALDPELAKSIAAEFGYKPEVVSFEEDMQAQEDEAIIETEQFEGEEEPRPPVVTVMGHVDHGKTSLLDAIRKTKVAAGEAGGITQSIGAYQVDINGRKITFIDTPGHAAFTSMRSRGAQVTDIVILVVAATDSVMPQTIEAINHAKAAGVPLLVAINKVDLPGARPDKVKTDLMQHGLVAEEFGGDVVCVPVSARHGTVIEHLLEMILLTADMRALKASIKRRAIGTVLEAGIDRGMGPFANVIVQDGTLRPGDAVIVGAEFGRVRALLDAAGNRLEQAGPATPVQVTGLVGVPKAGDRFQALESEARAREISEFRHHKRREVELAKSGARGTLQDISKAIAEGETKELAIVVKADVHGALEVLTKTLTDLSTDKVRTKIIHAGTGAITESDVLLCSASKAIIVGFNVRPERGAAELAEREKVVIRLHEIIYELVDEMKRTMAGLLDAVREEEFLGRAEVRQVFKVSRIGTVAGCSVQDGKIARSAEIRLVRDGAVVWTGRLATLKRFKDDAREVVAGFECGIGLQDFNDVKVGDILEAFTVREVRPESI